MAVTLMTIQTSIWASNPVEIDIPYKTGFAPLYVKARVTVERHPDNRELCVRGVEGEQGEEMIVIQRCFTLDGENAARTHWFEFKEVQAGRYTFYAVVRRPLEEKRSERIPVRSMAPGEGIE